MEKNTQIDAEVKLARKLASEGTIDSLAQLATLSSTVRNSEDTYRHLGLVSASNAEPVVAYILSQSRLEDDQLLHALRALSDINIPIAENAIGEIARNTLGTGSKFADCIGAEAIVALKEMGTETAADKILQLAYGDDDLVSQALTSLGHLYDVDENRFGSAYKQMLAFSLQPAVMDKTVRPEIGTKGEEILRAAFVDADKRRILPEVECAEGEPIGFATRAFDLAVAEARMARELEEIQQVRQDMSARLFPTRDR